MSVQPLSDEDSSNYQWPSDSHLGLFALILHTQLAGDPYGAPNVDIVTISESRNATHQLDTPWYLLEIASLGFVQISRP